MTHSIPDMRPSCDEILKENNSWSLRKNDLNFVNICELLLKSKDRKNSSFNSIVEYKLSNERKIVENTTLFRFSIMLLVFSLIKLKNQAFRILRFINLCQMKVIYVLSICLEILILVDRIFLVLATALISCLCLVINILIIRER